MTALCFLVASLRLHPNTDCLTDYYDNELCFFSCKIGVKWDIELWFTSRCCHLS